MINDDQSPLQFPCRFPIKAMGLAVNDLHNIVFDIVQRHAPQTSPAELRKRPSANGKYLAITVTIDASSRKQVDAIYEELTARKEIIMAL